MQTPTITTTDAANSSATTTVYTATMGCRQRLC